QRQQRRRRLRQRRPDGRHDGRHLRAVHREGRAAGPDRARLVAPLLPAATRAQRRQVLEQREQARAAREELRRGVARSRELTRKIRRLKRMANADVSGYPAARREAHERKTRRLAREIFGSDA
uniref:Uncharacterized protein n=1 Tax=Oryza glaberrima TaxID=4538 RepID=I1R5N0_ORYGL